MGDVDNGAASDVQSMPASMKAQAREIERLRMLLQRTSIKQKEDMPKLTTGAFHKFV